MQRRTIYNNIVYEKSTVQLTSVGLAQARPNYSVCETQLMGIKWEHASLSYGVPTRIT